MKMRRIKLCIAYDGTAYHGWQQQNGRASIEGSLNKALAQLLPQEKPLITGASRTDAGVHALCNVGTFDTASRIPAANFPQALNHYLPEDIRVMAAEEVPERFHPRFTAHRKCYEYHIDPGRVPNPLRLRYCYNYSFPLDLGEMQRAADFLTGVHDFRSFVNPDSQVFQHGGDAVREIYGIQVAERNGEIVISVSGNGFLYHMIRILAGTLLLVGRGKLAADAIPGILAARDRRAAGPTAPAKGLCLCALDYDSAAEDAEDGEGDASISVSQTTAQDAGEEGTEYEG